MVDSNSNASTTSREGLALKLEQAKLDACIHCGMCLPACPTYGVSGSEAESPRGRLHLMKLWAKGRIEDPEAVGRHLDPCLGCQACETACPSGVNYGHLLFEAREIIGQHRPKTLGRRLKRFIMASILPSRWLLHGVFFGARVYQKSGLSRLVRNLGLLNPFPLLERMESMLPTLRPLGRSLTPGRVFTPAGFDVTHGETVALFLGCVMDGIYRSVHWASIRALVSNGYRVVIPNLGCCGALPHHSGEGDIARKLALANVKAFNRLQDKMAVDWIVLNAAGCGAALKDYGHLLAHDEEWATQAAVFGSKVVDVMDLLSRKPLATTGRVQPQMDATMAEERVVTYDAACHLHHAQQVQYTPLKVLDQIHGVSRVPLPDADRCCGSAGVYNIEHPDWSGAMLADKVSDILSTGAKTVVTGNPGCMLQLEYGLSRCSDAQARKVTVRHPVELVAEDYLPLPEER